MEILREFFGGLSKEFTQVANKLCHLFYRLMKSSVKLRPEKILDKIYCASFDPIFLSSLNFYDQLIASGTEG